MWRPSLFHFCSEDSLGNTVFFMQAWLHGRHITSATALGVPEISENQPEQLTAAELNSNSNSFKQLIFISPE